MTADFTVTDEWVEKAAAALYRKFDTNWNHRIVTWRRLDDEGVPSDEKQKWRAMARTALRAADKAGQP